MSKSRSLSPQSVGSNNRSECDSGDSNDHLKHSSFPWPTGGDSDSTNSHDYMDHLQLESTTPLIHDLLQRNKIKMVNIEQFAKEIQILHSKASLITCHITPHAILNSAQFEFQFHLLFGPYLTKRAPNQPNDMGNHAHTFHKVYYCYEFITTRKTLKRIHNTTIKQMHDGKQYFARKLYPNHNKINLRFAGPISATEKKCYFLRYLHLDIETCTNRNNSLNCVVRACFWLE
eukprot:607482_1